MAKRVFQSAEYSGLVAAMEQTLRSGGRIAFSGCGATGRLSILLESMWRTSCRDTVGMEDYGKQVFSIMTGGDFALVKSVEFFEDYAVFGSDGYTQCARFAGLPLFGTCCDVGC